MVILLIVVMGISVLGHEVADTTTVAAHEDTLSSPYRFGWKQLIAPAALITVGTVGMEAGWFKGINNEFSPVDPHDVSKPVDDIIQYTPVAGLYALKLCGVRSRDSYVDISLLLAMSWMISAGTVRCIKHTVSVWRPDGTTDNSFPSGHTATAFMGAEMIRMEYGDNPWVAYSGYVLAAATGALRIHHKRHWFSDVLAGAGIGILSTRVAYWLYPYVTKYLIPPLYRRNVYLSAFGTPASAGVSLAIRF